jgi:hypothetical protein
MAQQVTVYHDETRVSGQRGHCLLFVPSLLTKTNVLPLFGTSVHESSPAELFLGQLKEIRERFRLTQKKVHFTDISGSKWTIFDLGVRIIADLLVDALRHRKCAQFSSPLCFKLAVMLYPETGELRMYGGGSEQEQQLRHDETVLRMLLKGASHFLYSANDPVVVRRIVSDGEPYHRHLDRSRVVEQLYVEEIAGRSPLRGYVEFAEDCVISHVSSDHKDYKPDTQDSADAHFLQMADLLLGTAIRARQSPTQRWDTAPNVGSRVASKKDVVTHPVRGMLSKRTRGRAFEQSGHYRAFTFNEVLFTPDGPTFRSVGSASDPASLDSPDDLRLL